MNTCDRGRWNTLKIGIVGGGHLGQAIALSLVQHGLPKQNLLISYRGNPLTYQQLKKYGLAACLVKNSDIFKEADIIFLTVKPQDMFTLNEDSLLSEVLLVSCAAGLSIQQLERVFQAPVCRMMISGPDTVLTGQGVAAIYPEQKALECLLENIEIRIVKTFSENEIDIFTVGVCLPAALLKETNRKETDLHIHKVGEEHPLMVELYEWAQQILPAVRTDKEREEYIEKMVTKGGITDAIMSSLQAGESLEEALRKGIARVRELSIQFDRQG
ncbi:pyrroline-5-carboxylate reductase family protein [Clostridium aminobutyricum]|uniref:NAD(P)-binding domain-containing protein n=1 Tax=Clostridium aminobutyricum TaxID=33953 RepID=A0A939D907_CLOAM|nr:NAD(P)-binding domain-containing protein [Clostridium aminobutyricum]MBN7773629.1 NAD(P)-binding domain-containing protein [Clostridium aminobutyricum]